MCNTYFRNNSPISKAVSNRYLVLRQELGKAVTGERRTAQEKLKGEGEAVVERL